MGADQVLRDTRPGSQFHPGPTARVRACRRNGNTYQVDELLTGHRVEPVFDPFDLADIEAPARRAVKLF
jgi:hypothetical protein